MRLYFSSFSGVLLSFLAACVPSVPSSIDSPPVQVSLNAAGRALASGAPRVQFEVRAFENVGKNRTWIEERAGVPCTITGKYYTAAFQTPANIEVIAFDGENSPGKIECRYDNETVTRSPLWFKTGDGAYSAADESLIFKR